MTGWWTRDPRVTAILDLLADVLTQGRKMMVTLSDITLAIQRQTTVEQGVVALLQQIASQLHDAIAAEDPAQVQAVLDLVESNTKMLSDAVLANTPSAVASATLNTPVPAPPAAPDAAAPEPDAPAANRSRQRSGNLPPNAPPHDEPA